MSSPLRLLGFAFAAADLLVELDDRWRVTYATGAPPSGQGRSEAMVAARLDELFTRASAEHLSSALARLKAGSRLEPIEVVLQAGPGQVRRGRLRAIMLPELAPCISCAIAYEGPVEQAARGADAIKDAEGFAERALEVLTRSHATATPLSLAMVELVGVDRTADSTPALVREVEALIQAASVDGATAGRIAESRYALLRSAGASADDLAGRVRELAARHFQRVEAAVSEAPVAAAVDPMASLRALRFTIDSFIAGGGSGDGAASMTFTGAVMRTLKEADDFRAVVAQRRFALNYQPVIKLTSGKVSHYEVLARFAPDRSPAGVIRMAEELALITDFDLAVADQAVRELRKHNEELKLAVNVSGQSLAADRFTEMLLNATAADMGARRRLTLEVTESAAMGDIGAANTRIQALRAAGFRVAIDDFGAGAASFDYLRRLSIDAVKIDGRYVTEAATDLRSQKMITHLVSLCRSLKLETVAEMIETDEVAALMLKLGVDQGQGWHFGRPTDRPVPPVVEETARSRRIGMIESWG
ncbi:MAG: EAL domain-containing protein [Caulobacteraceae bacterium]|nr:EAL domain-containing protein [Caulobacteraceae bacterium]